MQSYDRIQMDDSVHRRKPTGCVQWWDCNSCLSSLFADFWSQSSNCFTQSTKIQPPSNALMILVILYSWLSLKGFDVELWGWTWRTFPPSLAASSQISGAQSAYFPKDQDCLRTKSQLQDSYIRMAVAELRSRGVDGHRHDACLVCG